MTVEEKNRAISVGEFPEDFPGGKKSGEERTEGM
jgi:hypothetical protein